MNDYDGNPLEVEIAAEKAAAYFETVRKMEAALFALRMCDEKSRSGAHDTTTRQRREQLRVEAAERVWFFVIQREAMRLPIYEELFAEYEIPEEVRQQMGPKAE